MHRDLSRLASEEFDAVVVGGGVLGLTVAWELASRGYRIAVVERADFAGATSFNSLKTIHGGIRALQHGSIAQMREFVRERRAFATMAPHLLRPLPFIVPTYRHPIRNRWVMAAFLALYDRLATDRNAGVDPCLALPDSRTVGRAECLRLSPAIDPSSVTGGAIWYDYQLHSPERYALALLQSSVRAGAAAANYVDVQSLVRHGTAVVGVRARDRLSDRQLDIRGRVVVNAAGPWAWTLLDRAGVAVQKTIPGFSLALNLVVNHPPLEHAVGGLARSGRFLFMVPWRDRSIIGTSHDGFSGSADSVRITHNHVDAFLVDVHAALPGANISRRDIRLVHRGLLPARHGGDGTVLLKRSIVHDHRGDGLPGLLTVAGVRYTTARATAELAAERVSRLLGHDGRPRPAPAPLVGGEIRDLVEYRRAHMSGSGLGANLVVRLIAAYGTTYSEIARLIARDASLGEPLSTDCRVTRAEVLHAAREEMAVHLADALCRRTEAGTAGHPGVEAVRTAAGVMTAELGWTSERAAAEIAAVDEFFELP